MTIVFYHCFASPPCAAVLLAAKSIGVELNIKVIDYDAGEHLKPDFLKINPQHTLPTINDDGFILWESRPIMTYFADKYGKNDSLYPKEPAKRAVINQRLYFDMGTLYQRFCDYLFPQLSDKKSANPDQLKKLHDAMELLNTFLDRGQGQSYVTGDTVTLADISLVVTVATMKAAHMNFDKYENVEKWFARCRDTLPGWNIVDEHVEACKTWIPADL